MEEKKFYPADVLRGKAKDVPLVVDSILFHGIKTTKQDALQKEASELFNCATLHDLICKASVAAKHMQEVGLVKNAMPFIDLNSNKNGYIVNFSIQEHQPVDAAFRIGINTYGDADASLHAAKKSFLGRGESVAASYAYAFQGNDTFNFELSKPILGWKTYSSFHTGLQRSHAFLPWNNADSTNNSILLQHKGRLYSNRINHSLNFNAVWRTCKPVGNTMFSIREQCGHTSKISFENIVGFDSRDRPILPSRGIMVQWVQEIAGFLGDSSFFRNQLDMQVASRIYKDVIGSLSFQVKKVDALGPNELHFLDRVYMGGQYDVRGFEINTVGPRDENSTIGGRFGALAVAHLYKPLYPKDMLFAHAFLASGSVAMVHSRSPLNDILDTLRVSAGCGIAFIFQNFLRLEVNYIFPVQVCADDHVTCGFQIGAGLNFL